MRKRIIDVYKSALLLFLGMTTMLIVFSCCHDNKNDKKESIAEQTVLMYMPWSENGIYNYFLLNIKGMENAIVNRRGLGNKKFLVFISSNKVQSALIQIKYEGNRCVRDTLKKYVYYNPDFATSTGITSIINDVKDLAPAYNYAMIIGCHGMGWLPKGTSIKAPKRRLLAPGQTDKDIPQTRMTRFFGAPLGGDIELQTEISTLAEGIRNAAVGKMDYILFDDCYMSNIETAYELRNVTKYLIASTCEIMMVGMPYESIGKDLLEMDFKKVCDGFYNFYVNYSTPCGTIAVTDCEETERMAETMKRINTTNTFDKEQLENIQILDGITPTIFYDFGDYVKHLCKDEQLYKEFDEQLARLVPYCRHTGKFFSTFNNEQETPIKAFSGLTISEPTENPHVTESVKQTTWYKATH